MIEDELRELLTDRAGTVGDNPDRVAEVRSRIGGIRRRRTAGAALALTLVAVAGFALATLPGKPQTLPTGAPAGPYFGDDGTSRAVDGYRGSGYFTFRGDATWSFAVQYSALRHVVVARCDERGDLTLRNLTGAGSEQRLSCRVPVGDHYEGALPLDAGRTAAPDALPTSPDARPAVTPVAVRPGSGGSWTVGVLEPRFPDRLSADDVRGSLLTGFASAAGGRVTVTVPGTIESSHALGLMVVCVRDVRLEVTVGGHRAGVISCDDAHAETYGLAGLEIRDPVLQQLGLRPLQRVTIEIRSIGRQTPEWALLQVS